MTLKLKQNTSDNYFLIVGMGATGLSIAKYLQSKGERFHFFDTRSSSMSSQYLDREYPDARKYFVNIADSVVLGAEEIYISPGVPRDEFVIANAINHGKSVVGDVELFLREMDKPVIGITGSNGKSTVTTLVGLAAKQAGIEVAIGGNIGTPALELLSVDADLYVLELSSFQLESTLEPRLWVACNLNVCADHMDRYDSLSSYVMAKQRIYQQAENVIYNLDDPMTRPPIGEGALRFGFGLNKSFDKEEKQFTFCPQSGWLESDKDRLVFKEEIKLRGVHNLKNALALFAIADAAGIDKGACKAVLRRFTGLPHRCEIVGKKDSKVFVNDSKATNVGAAQAAIGGLAPEFRGIVLIAGGDGKGADFKELAKSIWHNVRAVILIGKDAQALAREIKGGSKVIFADSMGDAVCKADEEAEPDEVILLSPACASFDMFSNFEERGQAFIDAVRQLGDLN